MGFSLKRLILSACVVQAVLLSGCGDSHKKGTDTTSDKGSLSVNVVWPGSQSKHLSSKRALNDNPCDDFGISFIVATVYATTNEADTQEETWDCSDRQGTVGEVTPGEVGVVIEGYVGAVDDTPEWRGSSNSPLQVVANRNNIYLLNDPIEMSHTSGDRTGPKVLEFSPENDDNDPSGVPVNVSIEVRFDKPVSGRTVFQDSFFIVATTTPTPGEVSYNPVTRTARLDPTDDLNPGETYEVTVLGGEPIGIVGMNGKVMNGNFTWQFKTADSADTESPQVSSHEPSGNYVEIGRVIEVCFSEPMQMASITGQTLVVQSGGSNIDGTVTYPVSGDSCANLATFNPSAALENGTDYTVTIQSGQSGVKDRAGNELASDYSWNFKTIESQSTDLIWDQGNWNEKNWN